MPATLAQRWTFTQPSPLGDVHSSVELTAEGLHFRSDAQMGIGSQTVRWAEIAEAATAELDLPSGQGGPDMARWMPGRLEWLLISRVGSSGRACMLALPASDARDAVVAAVRERLGSRWVGESLALDAARQRFRLSGGGDTVKVIGLVLSVLAVLFVMLVLFVFASALLFLPAGFVLGGWCFRRGLHGLRDALQMASTPTAKVSSAAIGPVEFEGRAVTDQPSIAAVSGASSVWWDVGVDVWSDSDDDGGWKQVMARHGGRADLLVLEDATGRVPVWLRGADLLLQEHSWESGKQPLPERGVALLAGSGYAWNSGTRLRVRETRMQVDEPVYVFGTLDEARNLPATREESTLERVRRSLRTGAWRTTVLGLLPSFLRAPVGIAFAYLDMLFSVGRGGERTQLPQDGPAPALDPSAVLVWKGRAGRALIVSNRRESEAIAQLRKRSFWCLAIGGGILCYCLHELITSF